MGVENDPKELVKKYVADLHALIAHGHKAIARQVDQLKDSELTDAHRTAMSFKQVLERHSLELEHRLKALGGSTSSPVQDAASAVAGVVVGAYNAVRSEEASKSIRDDYTFFSHTAIASLMLHTTAKSLSDQQTAQLAEMIYRDSAFCVEQIDRLMPDLVLAELRKNGLQVTNVIDDSRKLISEAWRGGLTSPSSAASSGVPSAGSSSSL